MVKARRPIPAEVEEALEKHAEGVQAMLENAGTRTGQTPRQVIWEKNKAKLYRYQPSAEKKHPVPILMVYALINRPYVLDLLPGNSFIEYLTGQGFDVYLLDWGVPADEDADLDFEHLILDYMPRAVKKVLRTSAADEYTLLGYCMGGTMSTMYASLFPEHLKNIVLLTTPIDFAPDKTGLLGLLTDEKHLNPDLLVESFGNIPGELIDDAMRMLKPVSNYVGVHAAMWECVLEEKPLDAWKAMNKWTRDVSPFPGAAFRTWIKEFYQQDKLVKGKVRLRGREVNVSNITCPVLNIAGEKDHICPLPQAEATIDLVSSEDKEFFVLDAGHVGLLTGRTAKKDLWPKVGSWLEARSGAR
jgi:polyhydroxyalkanoate synthase